MIQIQTIQLVHHPLNPRKEVGDVTELAESIKENGILQNLTVVPTETHGVYKVVIGHRRLEAAILAGLDTVPCVVVDMDEQKQLSTMLLENMQRSDLTPYEQAQGIQQCIDFGMTIGDISCKTGFSKSTIRRRTKMLELDQDKVKNAVNATLSDYINLERITDLENRNKLLDYLGDDDFNQRVDRCFQEQEIKRCKLLIIEKLQLLKIECRDERNWIDNYEFGMNASSNEEVEKISAKLDELDDDKTYYYVDSYGLTMISVAQKKVETEKEKRDKLRREKAKEKETKINDKLSFYHQLRLKFMKELLSKPIDKKMNTDSLRMLLKLILIDNEEIYVSNRDVSNYFDELGIDSNYFDEGKMKLQDLLMVDEKELSKILIATLYTYFEDEVLDPLDFSGNYLSYYSSYFDNLYDFIGCFGYVKTHEETQLIEGSHELYKPID